MINVVHSRNQGVQQEEGYQVQHTEERNTCVCGGEEDCRQNGEDRKIIILNNNMTYRQQFNQKYGFPKDASHSVAEISKLTGYKKSGLETIFNKGVGAYYSNPQSVRPSVKSPQQWGYGRIFSAVMKGKAAKIDEMFLKK